MLSRARCIIGRTALGWHIHHGDRRISNSDNDCDSSEGRYTITLGVLFLASSSSYNIQESPYVLSFRSSAF